MKKSDSAATGKSRFFQSEAGGFVFAVLATVVWSFNFIAGRGLINEIPPFTLAAGRWGIAFLAVLPFALCDIIKERTHFLAHYKYYIVISLIGISFFNTAIYIAAHSVPALNLSLIACTSPIFTIILAGFFFGEKISLRMAGGIALAVCGILVLLSGGDISALKNLSFKSGDLVMLASAFSFAVYTLLLRKKPSGASQKSFLAVTFGIGLAFILPFSIGELINGAQVQLTEKAVYGLLYIGIGASLLAFWCWSMAIEAIGPSRASVVYYSIPFFCGIEAGIFLDEPILWFHYAGGILILCGLLLASKISFSK